MSEFEPIRTKEDLTTIDQDECVAGYLSGRHNDPEPGSDKSRSFWHGWRNGRVDAGHAYNDEAQIQLAEEIVRSCRAH